MKRLVTGTLIALSILVFSSCSSGPVVTERLGPPAYARPALPGQGYVWVDGDWVWTGGRYQWREGYWAPPGRRAWVSGHWVARHHGWYWRRGRWH